MVLYLSIICIAVTISAVLSICLGVGVWGLTPWWNIAILCGCVAYEFAVDGLFAWGIHELPDKWFWDKKIYKVTKTERKFYEKLHIKVWKDKVWELGGMGGFRKNKLLDPNDPNYIKQFLIESNKGVAIHIAGIIMGISLVFVLPFNCFWTISLPVVVTNIILNLMSIFVLRYNTPKLGVAYKRALRRDDVKGSR